MDTTPQQTQGMDPNTPVQKGGAGQAIGIIIIILIIVLGGIYFWMMKSATPPEAPSPQEKAIDNSNGALLRQLDADLNIDTELGDIDKELQ